MVKKIAGRWPVPLALRGWPRQYAEDRPRLVGHEALLVELDDRGARVLVYEPGRITELQMPVGDLCLRFMPDSQLKPSKMAGILLNLARTQARAGPGVVERLISRLKEPEIEKMVTKKAIKANGQHRPIETKSSADIELPSVWSDVERRTCLAIKLTKDGKVCFIPLDGDGLDIIEASEDAFKHKYRPLADYPVDRAARLYVEYSQHLGGTGEAMKELGKLANITTQEINMATTKSAARKAAAPAKKATPAKKAAKGKTEPAWEDGKKPAKKADVKKAPPKKEGPSAAGRFRELIMEGKKTDDQIFAAVQKEFGLDDGKRGYVKWYRNDLIKKGTKNVPEAK